MAPSKKQAYAYLTLVFARDRSGDLFFKSPSALGWQAGLFAMPRKTSELVEILDSYDSQYQAWMEAFRGFDGGERLKEALLWTPESLRFPWVIDELIRLRRSGESAALRELRDLLMKYVDGKPAGFKQLTSWRRTIPRNNKAYRIYLHRKFGRESGSDKPEAVREAMRKDPAWQARGHDETVIPKRATIYAIVERYNEYFRSWVGPPPDDVANIERALTGLERLFGPQLKTGRLREEAE